MLYGLISWPDKRVAESIRRVFNKGQCEMQAVLFDRGDPDPLDRVFAISKMTEVSTPAESSNKWRRLDQFEATP